MAADRDPFILQPIRMLKLVFRRTIRPKFSSYIISLSLFFINKLPIYQIKFIHAEPIYQSHTLSNTPCRHQERKQRTYTSAAYVCVLIVVSNKDES